jgi:16S rRNA (cytosine967-C5)-methyltransferase
MARDTTPRPAFGVIDAPRELVLRRVSEHALRFPNLDPKPFDADRMPLLDGAFAHAIYDACLRHWIALDAVIETACGRPAREQSPIVQAALLVGAAQLLALDRVPAHAAVDSTVEWTKASAGEGAGRFMNAALRRLADLRVTLPDGTLDKVPWTRARNQFPLSSGLAVKLHADCFAPDPWHALAEATSHPRRLSDHWRERMGEETAGRILAHGLIAAPTIINARADATVANDPALRPHAQPGFFVFDGDRAALMSFLDRHTATRVQDPTAAGAVALLVESGVLAGERSPLIIDVCAGQGTKSRQIAAEIPGARVVASDTEARRMETLVRLSKVNRSIEAVEPAQMKSAYTGVADAVLLDVPCSNSGVLARRLEARYRLDGKEIDRMVALQRLIIADALRLLKPRGVLLYSTCSIEREENSAHRDSLIDAGFLLLDERATLPTTQPGDPDTSYADGGYAVLLRRPD